MGRIFFILLLAASVSAASCSGDVIFAENHKMEGEKWDLEAVPVFNLTATDTVSLIDISFYLRTGTDYPFRNIWLFVTAFSPSGRTVTDTLEYMLSDISGKRYGDGFGNIREIGLLYRKGVYFPEPGNYSFTVQHGMRTETLAGVYDLGIMVRKAGSAKK